MKNFSKKYVFPMFFVLLFMLICSMPMVSHAEPGFAPLDDVYFTKDNCVIYAGPSYESLVLTTIGPNVPVKVVGMYSNGWYRISIGVIAYCKMDSLSTTGDNIVTIPDNAQVIEAKQIAQALGYEFHQLTMNREKKIKRDIFNSYVGKKAILYIRIDDELGVLFKMISAKKVKQDISLSFAKTELPTSLPWIHTKTYVPNGKMELFGQIAIFQFKVGYDHKVEFQVEEWGANTFQYIPINDYLTEFSTFAYLPVTQIAAMQVTNYEVTYSLSEGQRQTMANRKMGIKFVEDDTVTYRQSISPWRKEIEYINFRRR